MADAIPIEQVVDQIKQDVDWVFKAAYARGYNTAKAEIALSGEYERAYQRGKSDAQQWIPCSERLPENRLYVLVTYKYEYGLIDHGITWYGQAEEKWDTSREVIAWMPLPEPWKGEQK